MSEIRKSGALARQKTHFTEPLQTTLLLKRVSCAKIKMQCVGSPARAMLAPCILPFHYGTISRLREPIITVIFPELGKHVNRGCALSIDGDGVDPFILKVLP